MKLKRNPPHPGHAVIAVQTPHTCKLSHSAHLTHSQTLFAERSVFNYSFPSEKDEVSLSIEQKSTCRSCSSH